MMPNGVRNLPFQYQQRGPELAGAVADAQKFARFLEQRDQDLENYLANLQTGGGATVSVALLVDATLPATENLPYSAPHALTPFQALGNLEIDGGDLVYVGPNDPSSIICIAVAQSQLLAAPGDSAGFITGATVIGTNSTSDVWFASDQDATGVTQQVVAFGTLDGILAGIALDSLVVVGADAISADLTTSSGPLGDATKIVIQGVSLIIYAVE